MQSLAGVRTLRFCAIVLFAMALLAFVFSLSQPHRDVSAFLALGVVGLLFVWFRHREVLERERARLAWDLYITLFFFRICRAPAS